jgi:hypothetical protein
VTCLGIVSLPRAFDLSASNLARLGVILLVELSSAYKDGLTSFLFDQYKR